MNDEAIALQRASRHSHTVNSAVRNCHRYNLRAKRWERRKTDCLELNLFATQEAFTQISQGKTESKPGKRPARFDINPFGDILMILADVCAGDSSQEIRSEFTLRPSMFRFSPRPFFLDQLWLLSKLRVFLIDLAGGKFVSDNDVQPIVVHPFPKLAVREFFPVDVVQAGIAMCRTRGLGHF